MLNVPNLSPGHFITFITIEKASSHVYPVTCISKKGGKQFQLSGYWLSPVLNDTHIKNNSKIIDAGEITKLSANTVPIEVQNVF